MGIEIISPGVLSTIQSINQKNNTDYESMITANRIVCNNDAEGVLEMTAQGIECRFISDCVIVLTGADMNWEINGKDMPRYKAFEIKKGDRLTCGETKSGYRAYMAVAGGFDIPLINGSYSTDIEKGMGGFKGRSLSVGDTLNFRFDRTQLLGKYKGWADVPEFPDNEAEIRLISGNITDEEYTIEAISDKIGIFLKNKEGILFSADAFDIVNTDMIMLAQAQKNTKIKFRTVSEREAKKINFKYKAKLAWLDYRLMF